MTTILVTGANRGLGLEFVRQYAAEGVHVHAACRNPDKADALNALAASSKGLVKVHAMNVADAASVTACAKALEGTALDIIINNAGIYGPKQQSAGDMDYAGWAETHAVNTMGPLRVAVAFKEHLKRSSTRKMVAITSQMGSIAQGGGRGFYAYRSSKTALNMVINLLANDWRDEGITTLAMHPGWVRTDMGGPQAPLSPEESVSGMRKVIAALTPAGSGTYLDYAGKPIAW